jgi:hypothetical protein
MCIQSSSARKLLPRRSTSASNSGLANKLPLSHRHLTSRHLTSGKTDHGNAQIGRKGVGKIIEGARTKGRETLGCKSQHRLYSPREGPVYQGCLYYRSVARLEKGFSQGSKLGHAHAHILYQSWGYRTERRPPTRTGKSEEVACGARGKSKSEPA